MIESFQDSGGGRLQRAAAAWSGLPPSLRYGATRERDKPMIGGDKRVLEIKGLSQ
jgi:hypothetical protein